MIPKNIFWKVFMYLKKHLNFNSLREVVQESFALVPDKRAANSSNSLRDVMLSGLACMYFQSPSLLDFQRRMETKQQRNNLRSMFGVDNIPTDTGMRNIIDIVDTEKAFRPIYKEYFMRLQRGKHLEQYQVFPGKYLLNVDGTQYFSSCDINCKRCLTRGTKNKPYYCHQALQGAIVKSGLRQVIPVMPEEICLQDGDKKEDCEVNAFMRFIDKFRKDHDKLGIIINADALYATTSVIQKIQEHKANYIFKIKTANHKTLLKNVTSTDKSKTYNISRRQNELIIEWCNDIELFKTTKQRTNYLEAREIVPQKDGTKKVEYFGKWITDVVITSENAKTILDSARARWKIENECFNSLKHHGYNIEHSYGHGSENLCYNFYNFTLLAFTMHQIHQLTDNLFKKMRSCYGRLASLWHDIKALVNFSYFTGVEGLWEFIIGNYASRFPPP